jgi:YD repeat-containing protein
VHPLPHANDASAVLAYTETYAYDEVGNLLLMGHQTGTGGWTRNYDADTTSNRLLSIRVADGSGGEQTVNYTHDAAGNMTSMPHLPTMTWSADNRLQHVDLLGGGIASYQYDASGQRVRKVVDKTANLSEERIYFGAYEVFRTYLSGALELARQTVNVADDTGRVALIETLTVDEGDPVGTPDPLFRYQLANHLASVSVEVDATGLSSRTRSTTRTGPPRTGRPRRRSRCRRSAIGMGGWSRTRRRGSRTTARGTWRTGLGGGRGRTRRGWWMGRTDMGMCGEIR